MTTTTLKAGYKMTEIGVIPEDWEVNLIEQFGSVIDGDRGHNYPSSDDFRADGYCLFLSATNVTKTGFKFNQCQFISKEKDEGLSKGKLKRGDVALTTRGTVGNIAYYSDSIPYDDIRINSGMVLIRVENKNRITQDFLYELCKSNVLSTQIDRLSFGSAQPQLTVKGISSFQFPLPPTLPEQQAIATVLSDTDELIGSLDGLIAKKCRIKEGAMQELLTEKKRLSGFSGAWEVKKLGDVGDIYGGLSGKKKDDFENGKSPFITFLNVMNNVVIDTKIFEFVDVKHGEVQNKVRKGDLFFNTSSETPEEVGMCAVLQDEVSDLYLNSFCFGFRLKNDSAVNGLFLSYFINSEHGRKLFCSLGQGSTRYNLSKTGFNKIEINFPKFPEQQAIAQILSDMDTEITALEQKREKYKLVKQGLMQILLTGKIRLI